MIIAHACTGAHTQWMNFEHNIEQRNPGKKQSIVCVPVYTRFKMVKLIYGVRIQNDSYICHGKVTGKSRTGAPGV